MELSTLTLTQLNDLQTKLVREIDKRESDEINQKIKELKESGKFIELQNELKSFQTKNEFTQTITLNIPIKFTYALSTDLNMESILEYYYFSKDNIWDETIEANLAPTKELTRKQKEIIKSALDSLVDWACDDIFKLFDKPPEVKEFNKKLEKFVSETQKLDLTYDDLNEQ